MKILVLAPPMGATGGIQRYIQTFVRALREINGDRNVQMLAVPTDAEQLPDGSAALRSTVKLKFLLSSLMTAIGWRPELVICAHIGVAPVGRHIQRITRAPFWVILYGIDAWGELSARKVEALRQAQRLLSISRFTFKAAADRHSLDESRSAFLAPAVSFDSTQENTASASAADRPIVITVGRIVAAERYKGHDVVLAAWPKVQQQVPDALYVVAGDGDDLPRLACRAKELGLGNSVQFRGALTSESLRTCYETCRVFAMPARTELDPRAPRGEGFGIVFLEAMAHGKPVVGPNTGAPAEFIRSGEHGILVDPLDVEEVAQALIYLLQNPGVADQMGRAGRNWVQEQFSYSMFCGRLREILKETGTNH
jgi:phosphatidyl-myo-inositol dimannoside synthase